MAARLAGSMRKNEKQLVIRFLKPDNKLLLYLQGLRNSQRCCGEFMGMLFQNKKTSTFQMRGSVLYYKTEKIIEEKSEEKNGRNRKWTYFLYLR